MKLKRLAATCFATLMAAATLATSASAAEGYVEYPGGENPSPQPRIVEDVEENRCIQRFSLLSTIIVLPAAFLADLIPLVSLPPGCGLIPA